MSIEQTRGYKEGYERAMKECGGCTVCFGKGYSTQMQGKKITVLYCGCSRGKQLRDVVLK